MWFLSKKSSSPSPNSERRISRFDSWSNFLTGLGIAGMDKRLQTTFNAVRTLTEDELNAIYRSEGFGARGIDVFTEDMTKKPFEITGDPENKLAKELRKIRAYPAITECLRWALLHGGSIGVIGINDGGYLDEPVNEQNIQGITHIHVYDRWRVTWVSADLYNDPASPKFGTPEWYTIFPIGAPVISNSALAEREKTPLREQYSSGRFTPFAGYFRVHESRVMRFDGKLIPLMERVKNNYWNDSILQSVFERLRGLGEAYAGLELIISEFMLGTLSMEGLAGMIAGGNESLAIKRLQMIDQAKHILNTLLLDSQEEFKRDFANVAGLPQVMDTLILGIAAVWGIPVTRLMGQSPAGLNATGNNDMRMHYDKIASMQIAHMQEPCERLVKYIMLSKSSTFGGREVTDWEIEFQPLYELTEKEQAEMRKSVAETDAAYIDRGVLFPEEVAISRFGGNKYSMETNIDAGRERGLPYEGKEPEGEQK